MPARLANADVVLCNPPFEIFDQKDRAAYPKASAISGARAEAVLSLTLQAGPKALGFVLPRTFLVDRAYRAHRESIERLYREVELVSLPDGTFKVSQVESALLIARDFRGTRESQTIKSTEVDDKDRRSFALTGLPSRTREEVRSSGESVSGALWIPPLGPVWQRLEAAPRIGDFLNGHWGLRWHDGRQRSAGFEREGPNRALGFLRSNDHRQFAHGAPLWLDINGKHLYGGGNLPWRSPKILCNAARLSRGHWRLAAAVDRQGFVASQQFVGLWPKNPSIDLDALAAILNGPIANAYMTDHSMEKRFRIGSLLDVPLPNPLPIQVGDLAREYAALLNRKRSSTIEEQLSNLLDKIDAVILEAYDLSPRLTRAVLASFRGERRPVAHDWEPWDVSLEDPALTLREIQEGLLKRAQGSWPQERLQLVPHDEAAQALPFLP